LAKSAPKVALDEDVRPQLARLLRERGWDAISVLEHDRRGESDESQLRWAAGLGRILVSHNAADFARLAGQLVADGRRHSGVLLIPQAPVGWLLREVSRLLAETPDARDWIQRVAWGKSASSRPRRRRR